MKAESQPAKVQPVILFGNLEEADCGEVNTMINESSKQYSNVALLK